MVGPVERPNQRACRGGDNPRRAHGRRCPPIDRPPEAGRATASTSSYEAPHGTNARPSTGFVRLGDLLELIVADDAQAPVRRGRVPGTSRLSRLVSPRPRRPLDSAGHAVARSMAPMWCYPRRSPRIRDVEPALSCVIRQPARQVAEVHRSANDGDRPQLLAPDGVAVLIAHPEPASIVAQSAVTKHALALGLERPRVTPCHIALPEISETFGQSGHVAHLLR
jgi:hypothetical protein